MAEELKVIHFNTQGFQNKISSINKFVKLHDPDILVVTEHFQKNQNDLEKIDGYKIVNSFCRKHNERGGVAIWAKNGIPCSPRKDLDRHRKEREFELVSVSVGKDIVVTGAYRPPDTSIVDFHKNLEKYLNKIKQDQDIKHVLTGDFNIDNSKHNSTRNILKEHGLTFNLFSETHRGGGCIDNFITNFKNSRSRVIKSKSSKFSDHNPIELIVGKEVIMTGKKQESFIWRILNRLLFIKQEESLEIESVSMKKKTDHADYNMESTETVFHKIFHFIFSGSQNFVDNSKNKAKMQRNKPSSSKVYDTSENKNFFSTMFSYFTSDSSVSSSMNDSKIKTKTGPKNTIEKTDSIFVKIINFFKSL